MKYLLLILILTHGLIHLLGFAKELKLAPVEQLSGDTLITLSSGAKRFIGILWLVAAVLIVTATIQWWRGIHSWWMIGAAALVLSQLLIILYWKDARFGTIANIILLVAVIISHAQWQFNNIVKQEALAVISEKGIGKIVTEKDLNHLPVPVQNWLKSSGVIGKPLSYNARLKQGGQLRGSDKQAWMPASAEQYFNVIDPAFAWIVNAKMNNVISIAGRDKYMDGKGFMLIKPMALFTMVYAKGEKTDQGTMLRYLSELCWIPSAALRPYLSWEEVDSVSANVTMKYSGMTVSATFTFDEQDRIKSVRAKRYKDVNDEHLTGWYIPIRAWNTFEGVTVPVKGDVIWQLKDGDLNYYKWEITEINYNVNELY